MPTPQEIEAAKAALIAEINHLPRGEIARLASYIAERMLCAAENVRQSGTR